MLFELSPITSAADANRYPSAWDRMKVNCCNHVDRERCARRQPGFYLGNLSHTEAQDYR